jgi:hypothetical protein
MIGQKRIGKLATKILPDGTYFLQPPPHKYLVRNWVIKFDCPFTPPPPAPGPLKIPDLESYWDLSKSWLVHFQSFSLLKKKKSSKIFYTRIWTNYRVRNVAFSSSSTFGFNGKKGTS